MTDPSMAGKIAVVCLNIAAVPAVLSPLSRLCYRRCRGCVIAAIAAVLSPLSRLRSTAIYRYILFDADGTLFDYERAESEALRGSFERSGVPFRDDYLPRYREINSGFWRRFENGEITLEFLRVERFAAFFRDRSIDLDPAVFSPLYISLLGEGAFLFPGVRELLEEMSAAYFLAIITNGITEVQKRRIAKAGIGHFFRALIISEEIGISKPAPAYFDHAMDVLGISDRSEALIVGDSLSSDIKGGINSGIDTCWFNPAGHRGTPEITPTYEIAGFDQLRPIIEGRRA